MPRLESGYYTDPFRPDPTKLLTLISPPTISKFRGFGLTLERYYPGVPYIDDVPPIIFLTDELMAASCDELVKVESYAR